MRQLILIACLIILFTINIFAFDGEREGFILGFGAGYGYSTIEKVKRLNVEKDYTGVYTDLRIGAALTEQIAIHYSGKQIVGFSNGGWIIFYPGIGLTYYHKPQAPSIMFMTGIGLFGGGGSGLSKVARYDLNLVGSGINLYLGVGYEFAKHFMVEFNFSFSTGKIAFDPDHNTRMFSISLHYLAY